MRAQVHIGDIILETRGSPGDLVSPNKLFPVSGLVTGLEWKQEYSGSETDGCVFPYRIYFLSENGAKGVHHVRDGDLFQIVRKGAIMHFDIIPHYEKNGVM